MAFSQEFIDAFGHAMIYEVGAFFNMSDPEVIDGLCSTKEQRRKVGYVNDPVDPGGETKYGVAKNANPDLDIKNLTLEQAMQVYFDRYWIEGSCNIMPYPLNVLHFDGCTNHGTGRAIKFLQAALGIVPQTTNVGPRTTALIQTANVRSVCNSICASREQFYRNIVANKPSQAKYLNGWLRRITEIRAYINKVTQ